MAKKKFYAVKSGHKPGIYLTWAECEAQTKGFKGAKFAGFATKPEAEDFMKGGTMGAEKKSKKKEDIQKDNAEVLELTKKYSSMPDTIVAYMDGSAIDVDSEGNQLDYFRYSFGLVVVSDNEIIYEDKGEGKSVEASTMRNVAGELLGAMKAVQYAINIGRQKNLYIVHDYKGISLWVNGEWKAKNEFVKQYVQFIKNCESRVNISFIKVPGHVGNKFNERADALSREILGLEPR